MDAVIDIGTNSVRLMLAEFDGKSVRSLSKELETTRLGEGIATNLNLRMKAMERTALAVERFVKKARAVRAENIYVFATSALRDAPNKHVFTDFIKGDIGAEIDIISGFDEAQIGYYGAFGADHKGVGILIDIGGGSTELASGSDGIVESACSVPVGAVRLYDICKKSTKISNDDVNKMSQYIEERTFRLFSVAHRGDVLTGVSGTATTLASIDKKMIKYDPELINGAVLSYERVRELTEMLLGMTIEERRKLKGLLPQRADIIPGGAMIMEYIMRKMGFSELRISDSDSLEGYLMWKKINSKK